MTQRATSPKPTTAWLTAQEAENQEHIAQAAGSSLGEVSLPGASVWLNLSQAAQAGSASSRHLVWSERLRDLFVAWFCFLSAGLSASVICSGREGPRASVQFQGL